MYNEKDSYKDFLDIEEFENNIKNIWNNTLKSFQKFSSETGTSSFVKWDIDLVKQKDLYKILFKDTEEGYNKFLNAWDDYYKWWYREGQRIITKRTDDTIPTIYKLVHNKLAATNINPIGNFGIQVVLGKIPNEFLTEGSIFIVESIENFADENKIIEVSERLYKLICSTVEK
jgi:hypothetical protein